ncbi:signal peptidase I [Leucobacter sp. UT-8R-CII-1-4]|uniref:signal peptidase I n=1 Tax=Leucobacter sp. UT-8R-CII-1-4 TaxID=3040075 RepID=UPI0024A829AF|nr:signal peptidase I [Leucobacter sp. UT-8R-CII-1-4]MDI6023707.1 signal peptidase I [Leucobacter sp. UT-8R-CII-1-4]
MFRKTFGAAATAVLVVAALGLGCWFVYAATTGASIIVFRTGSMSPTMPQGALAVSVPVEASDVRVGDVITLQRAGESLPVTHRVIDISPVSPRNEGDADIRAAMPGGKAPDINSSDARQVLLQGDANRTSDPQPYAFTETKKTIFSLPYLGSAIMMLQSPIGMGILVIAVGALVTWAFWPKPSASESSTTEKTAVPV